MTNVPGIFAAGDDSTGPAMAADAIGDGQVVASAVDRYLGGDGVLWEKRKEPIPVSSYNDDDYVINVAVSYPDVTAPLISGVEEDVHDKRLLGMLEHGMDEIYVLNEKSGKFILDIPGVSTPIPIKLGPAGIIIV